jgi:hypothetical protein
MDPVNVDEADSYFEQGISMLEEMSLRPSYSLGYHWRGEFYSNIGRKDHAFNDLKKAESMFHEMGMDYWLDRTREVLVRL